MHGQTLIKYIYELIRIWLISQYVSRRSVENLLPLGFAGPVVFSLILFNSPGLRLHLTPWSRVLLENQILPQLVEENPEFYVTLRFITVFTTARNLSLP
jgi:hypothetical protein